jgi:hypothetical protein
MGGVVRWFEKRGEIPLVAPPGLREYEPLVDDIDRLEPDFTNTSVSGLAFGLEYCDSRGWLSVRTIRCLAIDARSPALIHAYCRVVKATRTFRVDRIISITEQRTGRLLSSDEHVALLAPYLPQEKLLPETRALVELQQATLDGVYALLQVAMAEGRIGDNARRVIVDHVNAEAKALRYPMPSAEIVGLWLDNLAPSLDSVMSAVERLLEDRERLARLLPWLLKLVRSEESLTGQEESLRDLFAEIRAHFRHRLPDRPLSRRVVS